MANHSPKVLVRKIRDLEAKYEKVNPKAVLDRARIMFYFAKYTKRLNALTGRV